MSKKTINTEIGNKITDKILLDKCQERKLALISKEEFEIWLKENITVKSYVGIELKYAAADIVNLIFSTNYSLTYNEIANILNDGDEDATDCDMFSIMQGYDITKLIFILSQYIDIQIGNNYRNAETYDLIYESGLLDYVLSYCERDYVDFNKKIDRAIGIESFPMMKEITSAMGSLPTQEKLQSVVDTIEGNQDVLDKLTKFNEMNDPMTAKIADIIRLDAIRDAMQKEKNTVKKNKK